jgi:next-to-BRCA1 protein 1
MASFVSDLSIPDGTSVKAGTPFIKAWRVRNDGQTAWPSGCKLRFDSGERMNATNVSENSETVDLPPLAPGAEFDVAVKMRAPDAPGKYMSYWRVCTPDHQLFGHRLWVEIAVPVPEPVAPAPTPAPAPAPVVPKVQPAQPAVAAFEYPAALDHLAAMGFGNTEYNKVVLRRHRGNILESVQELLQQP